MGGKSKENNSKIAVYTAIFGNYDDLMGPLMTVPGCDFYCFTDNKDLKAGGFKMVYKNRQFEDPTRDARMYKILPHKFLPGYDYTVWLDGSLIIKDPRIAELVSKALKDKEMALFKHRERNCIYKELEVCIEQKRDDPEVMRAQIEKYRKEGYPENNGLGETGVLIRKKSNKVIKHNEAWWNEIESHSKRDQLSFNYVLWKQGLETAQIEGNAEFNPYFYWHAIHGSKLGILGPAFDDLIEKQYDDLRDREEKLKELISESETLKERYDNIQKSRFWKLRNRLAKLMGRSKL
jgi:hypothetical protein